MTKYISHQMARQLLSFDELPESLELDGPWHNYQELMQLIPIQIFRRGSSAIIDIAHDDECAVHQGGLCHCRPNLTVREVGSGLVMFSLRWLDHHTLRLRMPAEKE